MIDCRFRFSFAARVRRRFAYYDAAIAVRHITTLISPFRHFSFSIDFFRHYYAALSLIRHLPPIFAASLCSPDAAFHFHRHACHHF